MESTNESKLREFFGAFQKASKPLPYGGLTFDGAALHLAVRTQKEGAAEFVRRECELAAANVGHLQIAVMLARIWEKEHKDDSLFNFVVSRGQALESIYGEPPERKAAREWLSKREGNAKRGICDGCRTPFTGDEGYLLDGRYEVWPDGQYMGFGTEMLCVKCFWKRRYDPRDPNWRNRDDVAFIQ